MEQVMGRHVSAIRTRVTFNPDRSRRRRLCGAQEEYDREILRIKKRMTFHDFPKSTLFAGYYYGYTLFYHKLICI
jgi:hypothetical protein